MVLERIFAAFVVWTLARNGSPLTVYPEDDLARSTPDPVPSPPSPRCAERMPEPTADGEPEPATTDKPSSHGATVLRIAMEPEPLMTSVKVREPATEPDTWENAAERSSAPCIVAEGELIIQLGLLDMEGDLIDWETGRVSQSKNIFIQIIQTDMFCLQTVQLVHYLQKVNFTTGFGDHVSFDENGDALAIYDVMNWQPSSDGSIIARTVGVVDEVTAIGKVLTLEEDAIYWNLETNKVSIFTLSK